MPTGSKNKEDYRREQSSNNFKAYWSDPQRHLDMCNKISEGVYRYWQNKDKKMNDTEYGKEKKIL